MMPWAIPASTPPPPPPSTRSSEQRRRRRKQKSQGGRFDAVFPASLPTLLQPPPFVQFWEEGKKVRKWTGRLNKGNLSCQLAKVSNFTVSLWRDIGFSASYPLARHSLETCCFTTLSNFTLSMLQSPVSRLPTSALAFYLEFLSCPTCLFPAFQLRVLSQYESYHMILLILGDHIKCKSDMDYELFWRLSVKGEGIYIDGTFIKQRDYFCTRFGRVFYCFSRSQFCGGTLDSTILYNTLWNLPSAQKPYFIAIHCISEQCTGYTDMMTTLGFGLWHWEYELPKHCTGEKLMILHFRHKILPGDSPGLDPFLKIPKERWIKTHF